MTAARNVILLTGRGAKLRAWDGFQLTRDVRAAKRYTEAGARRLAQKLADHYRQQFRMETVREKNPQGPWWVEIEYHRPSPRTGRDRERAGPYGTKGMAEGVARDAMLTGAKFARVISNEPETRKKNPVPASSRAGRHTRAGDDESRAANLYERFTGHKANRVRKVNTRDHAAMLEVGTVDGILYSTKRDGKTEQYIHHFHRKSRPSLIVSPDGKEARTLGGRFTFTERGFVDEDGDGNPIE